MAKKKLSDVNAVANLGDNDFITSIMSNGEIVKVKKGDLLPIATSSKDGLLSKADKANIDCFNRNAGYSYPHNGDSAILVILIEEDKDLAYAAIELHTSPIQGYSYVASYATLAVVRKETSYFFMKKESVNVMLGTCTYNGKNYICAFVDGASGSFRGYALRIKSASNIAGIVKKSDITNFTSFQ